MKNRKAKAFMAVLITGALVLGSTAYVPAAETDTEDTAEASQDETEATEDVKEETADTADTKSTEASAAVEESTDRDQEQMKKYLATWDFNGTVITFLPYGNVIIDGELVQAEYNLDGLNLIVTYPDGMQDLDNYTDLKSEITLWNYDAQYFDGTVSENDHYLDTMMVFKLTGTDNSDPMNPTEQEETVYGLMPKDQSEFLDNVLYGYTWKTDNGTLSIDKDGNISLNDGERTGTITSDNGVDVTFSWDGADDVAYTVSSADEVSVTLTKADDSKSSFVLSDREPLAE